MNDSNKSPIVTTADAVEMLSHISNVVGIIDVDGIIRYKSPNSEKLFGWLPEDLIGRNTWENIHPDDLERAKGVFEALLRSDCREANIKLRYKTKFGAYKFIHLFAKNLVDNSRISGILINYHDISELEIAETNLRASEERFKALHNASFGGIAIHDKGVILDCNKGLEDLTGYSISELTGMDGLKLIAPCMRDFVMEKIVSGYGKPYEAVGLKKNGEEYPLRLHGKNIPYKNKTVRVVEFRDITEAKKWEFEIQEKNNELADALTRLQKTNSELELAKEKAEESDRLKTAFLSNLSHEIRTPMNGILGFAELLKSNDLAPDHQEEYINVIEQSGERMLNLIQDLIDISHIETGQVKIKKEIVNINLLLDRLFSFFSPIAKKKDLKLLTIKGLPDEASEIQTDPNRLEQILSNLIGNAIKFTTAGFVKFGYDLDNGNLQFSVLDTGCGIPDHLQQIVFERFRQVDDTTSRVEEGSGLGLAISKSLVELLGGELGVKSNIGVGSEFFFTLPNTHQSSSPSDVHESVPKGSPTLSGMRVLVAEDDEFSFSLLKTVLEQKQAVVIHAKNGNEAVECFQHDPNFDLILMDMKMPQLSGLDATRKIRSSGSDIPIIAQTAYASQEDQRDSLEAGCNDLIAKPIKIDLLLEKIQNLRR